MTKILNKKKTNNDASPYPMFGGGKTATKRQTVQPMVTGPWQ
jgi:hypothetical protein